MKKIVFSISLFFLGLLTSFSQSSKSLFVELGGMYSTFQDVKYSAVSYGGVGSSFKLGFENSNSTSIWSMGLSLGFGNESPNTHSATTSSTVYPKLYGRYLKRINKQLSIGAHWDIFGLYIRKTAGLANNETYIIGSSDLFVSGMYQVGKLNFGLDIGLLSFQKEGTGFAFSAPQNGLEDGDFDYQNEALDDPLNYKYYTLSPIPKKLNLRTQITYRFGDRLSVGYQWNVIHFSTVKNYPVTIGNHQLLVRYNIIHKTNSAKKPKI